MPFSSKFLFFFIMTFSVRFSKRNFPAWLMRHHLCTVLSASTGFLALVCILLHRFSPKSVLFFYLTEHEIYENKVYFDNPISDFKYCILKLILGAPRGPAIIGTFLSFLIFNK